MKWYGVIGYADTVQTSPGVWKEQIKEVEYYGDVITLSSSRQSANQVNDNIVISNQISFIADPYANQNFSKMRYVEFMGTKWEISKVDVRFPRLILTLGGVYNGK